MMELQKSCGAQTVKDSMEQYFETHRAVTTMVPNENKAGMLITRLVAIDKKCVENENKAAAYKKSVGDALKSMSADAANEKLKASKRTGMLSLRLKSIDIKFSENVKKIASHQKYFEDFVYQITGTKFKSDSSYQRNTSADSQGMDGNAT